MRKAGPLGTFRYVYSGQNSLLAQHEPNGWKSFAYLGGQPIAMVSTSSARYFIHTDHLGRPELVTNVNRQAVWKGSRGTYSTGVVLNDIGTGIPMGFPGQVWDEETQTWHNGFRDYDPYTGRYIQSDPIGLEGGINTYAYVGANPISQFDPLGRSACVCPQAARTQAKVPDGKSWEKTRINNGQAEIYRFGRWNPGYEADPNLMSDYFFGNAASFGGASIASGLATKSWWGGGWGLAGSLAGSALFTGYQGVRHHNNSSAELLTLRNSNNAALQCGFGGMCLRISR